MASIRRSRQVVLALHGFALGGPMFDELAALVTADVEAPDLPGHGGRDAANTQWGSAVGEVIDLVAEVRPSVVVGYSMGGRLALGAAMQYPDAIAGLVLISAGIGISDAAVREARVRSDEELAARIEATGLDEFLQEWENSALVGGHPALMPMRRRNTATGLAASLRGCGQGRQPWLGDALAELETPIVWIAGGADPKYVAIAQEAAARSSRSELIVVPEAGHNVVMDAPDAVAAAIAAIIG